MSKKDWTWASSNRHGYRGGKMAENIDGDDMDDGYDSYEEYNGEEDEEWYEEEEQQESAKEGEKKHVDPTSTGGGGALSDFITTKKKDKPAPTQPTKPAADPESLLSKEEAEKMRDDLLQHGVQSKNIPKAHAALKQMHESIIGGETAAHELLAAPRGCGKAYEEFPEEIWDQVLTYLEFPHISALSRTCTWMKLVASSAPSLPKRVAVRVSCNIALRSNPLQLHDGATELEAYIHRLRYNPVVEEEGWTRRYVKKPVPMMFEVTSQATVWPAGSHQGNATPDLQFPWDALSSITFAVAKELQQAWAQYQGAFLSKKEYLIGRDENKEVVRREKDPEGNKQHLDIIARHIALYERIAQTTATNVWLAMLDEVKQHSATFSHVLDDDHTGGPPIDDQLASVFYCRIKANEAAGMLHTALQLGEEALAKKPWTMRDVGMPLAKTIGVPDSEDGWKEFVCTLPRTLDDVAGLKNCSEKEVDVSVLGDDCEDDEENAGGGTEGGAASKTQLRQRWLLLRRRRNNHLVRTAIKKELDVDKDVQHRQDVRYFHEQERLEKEEYERKYGYYLRRHRPSSAPICEEERLKKLKESMTPAQWRLWKQNNNSK